MSDKVEVKIERMHPDVVIPSYKHDNDSGMDVRAFFHDEWVRKTHFCVTDNDQINDFRFYRLMPGGRAVIPTGIRVAIPNGYEIQVRPRSGMAIKEGLTILNTPGTVDAGYRGEIGIIVYNTDLFCKGTFTALSPYINIDSITISHGDRIAQLVLQIVPKVKWVEVESVDETQRGEGGFGSSGIK